MESGGQTSLTQNLLPEDSKGPIQLGYVFIVFVTVIVLLNFIFNQGIPSILYLFWIVK